MVVSETSKRYDQRTYYWCMARRKWVSGVTREATAGWLMVINLALSINSACSHAWIFALVVNASLRVSAIRILNAFRSAALVGITSVIRQTSTRSRAIMFFTYGVRTARRRITWQLYWKDSYKTKIYLFGIYKNISI